MNSISKHFMPSSSMPRAHGFAGATLSKAIFGLSLAIASTLTPAFSAVIYWFGATSGDAWNTTASNKNWNSSLGGTSSSKVAWTDGADAYFNNSNTAVGTYSIAIGATNAIVANITVIASNSVTLTGTNTLTVNSGSTIDVASGSSLNINSVLVASNFTKSGVGTLSIGATNTFSTVTLSAGTLALATGTNLTITTLNVTGSSVIDFTGSNSLSVGTLTISSGATLTINSWDGADSFTATTFTNQTSNSLVVSNGTTGGISFTGFGAAKWNTGGSITPVPEPATYGALLMTSALGGFFFVRRRRA